MYIGCSCFGVKVVMFFLCTLEQGRIIKTILCIDLMIGKETKVCDTKATGSVKWHPVA